MKTKNKPGPIPNTISSFEEEDPILSEFDEEDELMNSSDIPDVPSLNGEDIVALSDDENKLIDQLDETILLVEDNAESEDEAIEDEFIELTEKEPDLSLINEGNNLLSTIEDDIQVQDDIIELTETNPILDSDREDTILIQNRDDMTVDLSKETLSSTEAEDTVLLVEPDDHILPESYPSSEYSSADTIPPDFTEETVLLSNTMESEETDHPETEAIQSPLTPQTNGFFESKHEQQTRSVDDRERSMMAANLPDGMKEPSEALTEAAAEETVTEHISVVQKQEEEGIPTVEESLKTGEDSTILAEEIPDAEDNPLSNLLADISEFEDVPVAMEDIVDLADIKPESPPLPSENKETPVKKTIENDIELMALLQTAPISMEKELAGKTEKLIDLVHEESVSTEKAPAEQPDAELIDLMRAESVSTEKAPAEQPDAELIDLMQAESVSTEKAPAEQPDAELIDLMRAESVSTEKAPAEQPDAELIDLMQQESIPDVDRVEPLDRLQTESTLPKKEEKTLSIPILDETEPVLELLEVAHDQDAKTVMVTDLDETVQSNHEAPLDSEEIIELVQTETPKPAAGEQTVLIADLEAELAQKKSEDLENAILRAGIPQKPKEPAESVKPQGSLRDTSEEEGTEDSIKSDVTAKASDIHKMGALAEQLSLSPDQVEAVLERVIRKMFADKIERLLMGIIEKAVSKEMNRLKDALIESLMSGDAL